MTSELCTRAISPRLSPHVAANSNMSRSSAVARSSAALIMSSVHGLGRGVARRTAGSSRAGLSALYPAASNHAKNAVNKLRHARFVSTALREAR